MAASRSAREHFLQFLQRLGKNAPTLVLVTHHVEEIMPVFSHVLILKDGAVLAQGKKSLALTGKSLSEAFAARVRLQKRQNRYFLNVAPKSRTVV